MDMSDCTRDPTKLIHSDGGLFAMNADPLKPLEDHRVREFLEHARVAHLATADRSGAPHNIPLCFWFDGEKRFYFVIDEKPKRLTPRGLKRMRNIAENPQVALVVDHFDEDWSRLAYVLIHGNARPTTDREHYAAVLRSLRDKYPQYRTMALDADHNPMVVIEATRVHRWGARFNPPA
jgi:PPOX class probable F420-dependent enzyme